MKLYYRIFIGIIIISLGILSVKQAFQGQVSGILSVFQNLPFVLLLIFTLVVFLLDITYYKLHKNILQFATSFIGLLFCAITFYKLFDNTAITKAKTILEITNLPAAQNVINFEFKQNNKFKLTEYSRLSVTVFYGDYIRQNNSIIILKSNYSGFTKELPKYGIIKADTMYWNNFDTMILVK